LGLYINRGDKHKIETPLTIIGGQLPSTNVEKYAIHYTGQLWENKNSLYNTQLYNRVMTPYVKEVKLYEQALTVVN
jgi:hypothetical protein